MDFDSNRTQPIPLDKNFLKRALNIINFSQGPLLPIKRSYHAGSKSQGKSYMQIFKLKLFAEEMVMAWHG